MADITITEQGNTIAVRSPYDPGWSPRAKRAGGKWSAASKTWTFNTRSREQVEQALTEVYGWQPEGTGALVTYRLTIPADGWEREQTIRIAGREVVSRRGRDTEVRLADGVVLIEGDFYRNGGSAKHPIIDRHPQLVLELRDWPESVESMIEWPHETVGEPTVDVDALRAERERLAARIAEIDAILAAGEVRA